MKQRAQAKVSLFSAPLTVLGYFLLYCFHAAISLFKYIRYHKIPIILSLCLITLLVRNDSNGLFLWYSYWIALGVASSIGLGTGLHTFVLFLGPFIAQTTITAFDCKSLDFPLRGPDAFTCPESQDSDELVTFTVWQVFSKVRLESFFWGLGTAIGELPPYFVSRAAALAGQENDELEYFEALEKTPHAKRPLSDRVQLFMYKMMKTLGFWGILIAASIPNPLFDLAGIMCGQYSIPFATFFSATFIGKAIIKSSIQSLFVVTIFSKDALDFLLAELALLSPRWSERIATVLHEQHRPPTRLSYIVSLLWNGFLVAMIIYFVLSIVQSLALSQMKKEGKLETTPKTTRRVNARVRRVVEYSESPRRSPRKHVANLTASSKQRL